MLNEKQLQTDARAFFTYFLTSSDVRHDLERAEEAKSRPALLDLINGRLGVEPALTDSDLLPFFETLQRVGQELERFFMVASEPHPLRAISVKPPHGGAAFLEGPQ